MNDYWKLPKEVRKTVQMKAEQLKKKIVEDEVQIHRLTNQLSFAKYDLEKAQKELAVLCREHNLE